ncbi:MAG: glycosyltransferase family 2 protein [Phototrophicaceae bacterium]
MIDLSIIIVSWNVQDLLIACLDSIIASPVAINEASDNKPVVEIIVVDSASSDDTVSLVRENYPQVRLSAQSDNVGFTRGNNIGFDMAQGRYLLMLNPDTEVLGDALVQMLEYMDSHENVGLIGPHTLNTDRTTQSSRRHFPTKALAFFESTWLQPFAPKSMMEHYYLSNESDTAILEVDWMQGSALMTRYEIYEAVGGLDTGFVMYSEEMDWCKRIKDTGWSAIYLGTAQIIHHGGKSSEQIGAQKHIWFQESKLRYFKKHHGAGFAFVLRLFLLLNYIWQLSIEGIKGLIGHKRALRKERVQTYWQVLRSGLKVS